MQLNHLVAGEGRAKLISSAEWPGRADSPPDLNADGRTVPGMHARVAVSPAGKAGDVAGVVAE
jgi:hypothetical protein